MYVCDMSISMYIDVGVIYNVLNNFKITLKRKVCTFLGNLNKNMNPFML